MPILWGYVPECLSCLGKPSFNELESVTKDAAFRVATAAVFPSRECVVRATSQGCCTSSLGSRLSHTLIRFHAFVVGSALKKRHVIRGAGVSLITVQ